MCMCGYVLRVRVLLLGLLSYPYDINVLWQLEYSMTIFNDSLKERLSALDRGNKRHIIFFNVGINL